MTREKAIFILMKSNEYHHAKGDLPHSALSVEAFNMAIEALKEQRPHGEWIIVDDCEKFIARCSVCGRILDSRMVKDYPFCRCGADMRKKVSE